MTGTGAYQTELDKLLDITVSSCRAMSMTSQEYIDRLVADLIENKTLAANTIPMLITAQERVNRFVADLLRDATCTAS